MERIGSSKPNLIQNLIDKEPRFIWQSESKQQRNYKADFIRYHIGPKDQKRILFPTDVDWSIPITDPKEHNNT